MGDGVTRWLWALGYTTASLVLLVSEHRGWAGLVAAGAACHLWGVRRGLALQPTSATLDHYVPWAQGGSNDMDNLWTLCWEHNREKGARTYEQWLRGDPPLVLYPDREREHIPAEVRLAVYERDNYVCRHCGVDVS